MKGEFQARQAPASHMLDNSEYSKLDVAGFDIQDVAGSVFTPQIQHDLKQDQKQQTTEQPFQ